MKPIIAIAFIFILTVSGCANAAHNDSTACEINILSGVVAGALSVAEDRNTGWNLGLSPQDYEEISDIVAGAFAEKTTALDARVIGQEMVDRIQHDRNAVCNKLTAAEQRVLIAMYAEVLKKTMAEAEAMAKTNLIP